MSQQLKGKLVATGETLALQTLPFQFLNSEVSRMVRQLAVNQWGNQLQVRFLSSEPFQCSSSSIGRAWDS